MRPLIIRMFQNRYAAFFLLPFILAITRLFAEGNGSDSVSYFRLKAKILPSDSLQVVIETADALAGQGLFAEAIDMLIAFAPKKGPVTAVKKRDNQWRGSTGIDYYHFQDVDTVAMTPDELHDYQRLTKTPLVAYTRASYEVRRSGGRVEKLTPELSVSSYKTRVEVPVRIVIGNGRFSLEPAVKAEKWFDSAASEREPFAPVKKQPSDMGGASLRLDQSSALFQGARWSVTAPVFLDWEHYRSDRPGYESFVEGRISPSLELRYREKLPLSTRLTAEARYEGYYRKVSDSLSVVRFLAGMENDFISPAGLTMNLSASWLGDRYARRHIPADIDQWEGLFRCGYTVCHWLEPRMYVRGMHERERYEIADSLPAYALPGTDLTVRPSGRFRLSQVFAMEPELNWRQRWSDMLPEYKVPYLWQAYTSWEPGIRLEFSSSRVEISVRTSYRTEDVDSLFERYINDSRSIKASGDASLQLFKALSINVVADYQYRIYKPYGSAGRVTENLSLSGQMTMKW